MRSCVFVNPQFDKHWVVVGTYICLLRMFAVVEANTDDQWNLREGTQQLLDLICLASGTETLINIALKDLDFGTGEIRRLALQVAETCSAFAADKAYESLKSHGPNMLLVWGRMETGHQV